MKTRYKIIISNNNLYKEFELSPEMTTVQIGTEKDCDFRLRKDLFFESVSILLDRKNDDWIMICSDNLYISAGDVRKLITKELHHGDAFSVRYQNSDSELFQFAFSIDFNDGNIRYERAFDISGKSSISIGTDPSSDIAIKSRYTRQDNIVLENEKESYLLRIRNTSNGIYHDGKPAANGERIFSGDFLSISECFFYLKDGRLWTEKGDMVSSGSVPFHDIPDLCAYPCFERNTRIKLALSDEKIEILDPPAKQEKPKDNLLMRLLPSVGMLAGAGIMAMFGGMTMIIISGISAFMAVLTAFLSLIQNKREYKAAEKKRVEQFTHYIEEKENEIQKKRLEEWNNLEELYRSSEKEQENFTTFSPALFDRSREDEDFLCVRLGDGEVEAKQVINYKKQEKLEVEDELQNLPENLCETYKNLKDAPVICDFKSVNAVGVVGSDADRFEIFKIILLDLLARHHYSDLKLFFITENRNKDQVRWLRMLPYVFNESIQVPNIVCDDESKNLIFEYLYKELTSREQEKKHETHFVIFFYDEYGFQNHPISKFVDHAKNLDTTFVFFGENTETIANGCSYVVSVRQNEGKLIDAADKNKTKAFHFRPVPDRTMHEIVEMLAPVYTEDVSLESDLTKNISLYDLLNIMAAEDLDLAERWSESKVYQSMGAPIGVSKTGIVSLDLHDKAYGPHGLVAGTTGSGKSEILQTYFLSMITLFHPYEVGFVIIDFKGGGMANQFKNAPHLLGAITNIDGKAINRSLKSIKAELQKRQKCFAEADVNHIDKYIKKYKNGEVQNPLPHLIIIVDEFAELKAEQPDFMKELISAARIGRSLGVHLILATQKPAGQVNEQIWSNSRFKLCLKVQSQEDSNEVLKSPLAAEIKEPGRAYLQVGNNEIFELFQSAYSGAPDKPDESTVKEFEIYSVLESGKKVCVYQQKKETSDDGNATQLNAVVEYVEDYCKLNHIEKLPDICLPALGELIRYPQREKAELLDITADIGIYDDPDNQYQGTYSVNFSEQNMMIIGSSQSGKTNILQTIIRDLAENYTPDQVTFYIIDFASMILKNFESLHHVGGIVTASEDEKLKNLIKLLFAEIGTRKERLLSAGVSSFNAYKEAGYTDLPHIILMIDNFTALKELYFQEDEDLLSLCREGLSVGITVIVSNQQTNGIGFKYLACFNCRIAMFCNDSSEYYSLFDHCSEKIEDIHGRSLVEIDKEHYECQMYLSFDGEKEFERVEEIRTFLKQINERYPKEKAKMIPVIPDVLTADFVDMNLSGAVQSDFSVVAGLDYDDVSPFVLDFLGLGALGVSGKEASGKHNFMKYIVYALEKHHAGKTEVYIIDGISRKLFPCKNEPNVSAYETLSGNAAALVTEMEGKLAVRYEAVAAGNDKVLDQEKFLLLILNSADAVEAICVDNKALEAYNNIIGKYRNMNVAVIVGDIENKMINYNSPEIYRTIRDIKKLVFFGDLSTLKVFDVPYGMIREYKKPVAAGDCYYIDDVLCNKLKTPLMGNNEII